MTKRNPNVFYVCFDAEPRGEEKARFFILFLFLSLVAPAGGIVGFAEDPADACGCFRGVLTRRLRPEGTMLHPRARATRRHGRSAGRRFRPKRDPPARREEDIPFCLMDKGVS